MLAMPNPEEVLRSLLKDYSLLHLIERSLLLWVVDRIEGVPEGVCPSNLESRKTFVDA